MPITPKTGSLFHAETQSDIQVLQNRLREADDALERAQVEAAQHKRSTGFGRSM